VQSGGFASSTVVKSGGDETVGVGGTASGVIVSSGGNFEWFGSNPIVASLQPAARQPRLAPATFSPASLAAALPN
jgi:autotransporter passenger strand-loop-strand repeat protein